VTTATMAVALKLKKKSSPPPKNCEGMGDDNSDLEGCVQEKFIFSFFLHFFLFFRKHFV
jgi:hypothetical protein